MAQDARPPVKQFRLPKQPDTVAVKQAKKAFEHQFHPSIIKHYVDDLNDILAGMKSVSTPQQAVAFTNWFNQNLRKFEHNAKRYAAAYEHGAHVYVHKMETADTKQANLMLNIIPARGAEVEKEMARIVKLYPTSEKSFRQFFAFHD